LKFLLDIVITTELLLHSKPTAFEVEHVTLETFIVTAEEFQST